MPRRITLVFAACAALCSPTLLGVASAHPRPQVMSRVVGYAPHEHLLVLSTRDHRRTPAVLFVHGGSWMRSGWTLSEMSLAADIVRRTGWTVGVAQYPTVQPRRSVEPRAVHAALDALAHQPGVDRSRLALWGESAGGHLALLDGYRRASTGVEKVRAVVSVSGPTDMTTAYATGVQIFLDAVRRFEQSTVAAAHDDRYAVTSPQTLVTPASPPTFQAGSVGDPLVPPSQLVELDHALQAAGAVHQLVLVPGAAHATSLEHTEVPRTGRTVEELAIAFVARAFGR